MSRRNFKRAVLKLSGEALREPGSQDNISPEIVENIANQIKAAHQSGVEVAVVVGGGNFWRGLSASNRGMERTTADYVGMLATVMNSLAIQSMLEALDVPTRVQTAIEMKNVAEPFIRRVAMRHLERGRVVVFGAGTARESLESAYEGEDLIVAFNPQYLLEGVEVAPSDEIMLATIDELKPALVRAVGAEEFLYLLMPVRL